MRLAHEEHRGRDAAAIEELLKELSELRELDRRRQAHPPGSAAFDAATLEVDLRGRRLMDRFRDLEQRRAGSMDSPDIEGPAIEGTRRLDAQQVIDDNRGSRLN